MEISPISVMSPRSVSHVTPTALPTIDTRTPEEIKRSAWIEFLLEMPEVRPVHLSPGSLDPKAIAATLMEAEPCFRSSLISRKNYT